MRTTLIDELEAGRVLSRAEAEALMEEVLSGRVASPEIVRLLLAMNRRRVAVPELAGFATAMRRHAARPFVNGEPTPDGLIDTCGTGGKTTATFNISTAAAIVAAASGARVAKHGNRGMSSRSGSADVLEALGVRVDIPLERHGRFPHGSVTRFAPASAPRKYTCPTGRYSSRSSCTHINSPITR